MEGPPEMVEGMVMKVMTSCSLRPASRARKPPMAWIPSCELPAMRMTASLMRDTLDAPSDDDAPAAILLIKEPWKLKSYAGKGGLTTEDIFSATLLPYHGKTWRGNVSISYGANMWLVIRYLQQLLKKLTSRKNAILVMLICEAGCMRRGRQLAWGG